MTDGHTFPLTGRLQPLIDTNRGSIECDRGLCGRTADVDLKRYSTGTSGGRVMSSVLKRSIAETPKRSPTPQLGSMKSRFQMELRT
jgi:hypothetical protein